MFVITGQQGCASGPRHAASGMKHKGNAVGAVAWQAGRPQPKMRAVFCATYCRAVLPTRAAVMAAAWPAGQAFAHSGCANTTNQLPCWLHRCVASRPPSHTCSPGSGSRGAPSCGCLRGSGRSYCPGAGHITRSRGSNTRMRKPEKSCKEHNTHNTTGDCLGQNMCRLEHSGCTCGWFQLEPTAAHVGNQCCQAWSAGKQDAIW